MLAVSEPLRYSIVISGAAVIVEWRGARVFSDGDVSSTASWCWRRDRRDIEMAGSVGVFLEGYASLALSSSRNCRGVTTGGLGSGRSVRCRSPETR